MKKIQKRNGIISLALAFACFVSGGITSILANAEETAKEQTVQGVTYNTDDFTVTQDYGAYVDGTVFSHPVSHAADGVHAYTLSNVGSKVRLDAGKNGLLFTSKASGDDAVGKKVTLANKQLGDFSMDFRVFSKESAVGCAWVESSEGANLNDYERDAIYDDRHNPFQDMRRVDITFTSVSNPEKYFTVNIFGNDTSSLTDCSASVFVVGDVIKTSENLFGYGICDECGKLCYANNKPHHKTRLYGNTFSNSTNNSSSSPTSIWFDQENMMVYAKSYNETLPEKTGASGVNVVEEYRLIRDMKSNALPGAYTLKSEDFEAGYTVEIAVGDMTSNATALKRSEWDTSYQWAGLANEEDPSPYYRCAYRDFDVDGDGVVDTNYTYDRYANFIIYDINGAEMDVKDGWTVEETTLTTATAGKVGEGIKNPGSEWTQQAWYDSAISAFAGFGYAPGDVLQGLKFTSKVNNNGAVGEGFALNVNDFTNDNGAFAMKIGAEYDYTKATTNWAVSKGLKLDERGLGEYAEAIDQYSDVKELKLTFRSTVDPTKAFNLYLVSRTANRNGLAIYSEIEGETYINNSLHRGWSLCYAAGGLTTSDPYQVSGGSFGCSGVSDWGESDDTYNFPIIQFDPVTMTAYGYSNQSAKKIRNFGQEYSSTAFADGKSATLDSSYFYNTETSESTYTVSVSVERMNTKENYGQNTIKYSTGWMGSEKTVGIYASDAQGAPTEGWDHTAVIHVYKLYGDKTAEDYDLPVSTATYRTAKTSKTELSLGDQSLYEVGVNGVTLNVSVMDSFGVVSKPETVTYSGPSTGTVELTDGVGNFLPTELGEYVFTVGKMTRSISLVDTTAPTVTLKDTAKETYNTDDIVIGFDDVTVTDNYDVEFLQSVTIYKNGKAISKISGLGTYTIEYFVKDSSGNSATFERVINVVDDTAPTAVIGNHPTEYNVGDTVYLPVVTATDDFDLNPEITYTVTYDGTEVTLVNDSFIPEEAGEYTITISVVDASGNETEETSTIVVKQVSQGGGLEMGGEFNIEVFFQNIWNWILDLFAQVKAWFSSLKF